MQPRCSKFIEVPHIQTIPHTFNNLHDIRNNLNICFTFNNLRCRPDVTNSLNCNIRIQTIRNTLNNQQDIWNNLTICGTFNKAEYIQQFAIHSIISDKSNHVRHKQHPGTICCKFKNLLQSQQYPTKSTFCKTFSTICSQFARSC